MMRFEATKSKKATIKWPDGCTRDRPAEVSRVSEASCQIERDDVGTPRLGKAPRIYAQALAAGECGPADASKLPQGNTFGTYIDAGHIMGDQFGGPMGDTFEETANFFPQNSKINRSGLWKLIETCLSVCIQTVREFEHDLATGRSAGVAYLSWDFSYPNGDSLYPESVKYNYEFINSDSGPGLLGPECWDANDNYNFDDVLGQEKWDTRWQWMKSTATTACNTVRQYPSAAMLPSAGSITIQNSCDAPCGGSLKPPCPSG